MNAPINEGIFAFNRTPPHMCNENDDDDDDDVFSDMLASTRDEVFSSSIVNIVEDVKRDYLGKFSKIKHPTVLAAKRYDIPFKEWYISVIPQHDQDLRHASSSELKGIISSIEKSKVKTFGNKKYAVIAGKKNDNFKMYPDIFLIIWDIVSFNKFSPLVFCTREIIMFDEILPTICKQMIKAEFNKNFETALTTLDSQQKLLEERQVEIFSNFKNSEARDKRVERLVTLPLAKISMLKAQITSLINSHLNNLYV
jgi:hypothetical protein